MVRLEAVRGVHVKSGGVERKIDAEAALQGEIEPLEPATESKGVA